MTSENYPLTVKTSLPTVWTLFKASLFFYWHHRWQILKAVSLPLALSVGLYFVTPIYLPLVPGLALMVLVGSYGFLSLTRLLMSSVPSANHYQIAYTWEHFWPLVGLVVILKIIILGGLILLIVPSVVAAVYLSFSPFILLEKRAGYWLTLMASWEYVRRFWWAVLGRWLVLVLTSSLVLWLTYLPLIRLALAWLVVVPLGLAYLYQIYLALKRLKPELEVMPADSQRRRLWLAILLVVGLVSLLVMAYKPEFIK